MNRKQNAARGFLRRPTGIPALTDRPCGKGNDPWCWWGRQYPILPLGLKACALPRDRSSPVWTQLLCACHRRPAFHHHQGSKNGSWCWWAYPLPRLWSLLQGHMPNRDFVHVFADKGPRTAGASDFIPPPCLTEGQRSAHQHHEPKEQAKGNHITRNSTPTSRQSASRLPMMELVRASSIALT